MIGYFLDRVSDRVHRDLGQTIQKNESFLEHRWDIWEKQVVAWSKRPTFNTLKIFAGFTSFGALGILWAGQIGSLLPDRIHAIASANEARHTVLAVQAALVGVIYPLVIGFVGISLQDRASNRTLWNTYSRYTCVELTGLSSLVLLIAMISLEFLLPWLTHSQAAIASLLSMAWFVFNGALLVWFLTSTIRFIALDTRSNILTRFALQEVFIEDIKTRIAAQHYELTLLRDLPAKNDARLRIDYWMDDEEVTELLSVDFPAPRIARDVNLNLLKFAVELLRSFSDEDGRKLELLRYPFVARKNFTFAKSDREIPLPVRVILRLAFSLQRPDKRRLQSVSAAISAITGSLYDALASENFRLFETTLDDTREWHQALLESLTFINDEGQRDNWMMLSESGFGGRSYQNDLLREYYLMSRFTVTKIQDNRAYIRDICYFFTKFYSSNLPEEIISSFLQSHSNLWGLLAETEQRLVQSNSPAIANSHELLRDFVGSWENWATRARLDPTTPEHRFLQNYLKMTASFVVTSAKENSDIGIAWATDLLNYWFENLRIEPHPDYYPNTHLVTFDDLDLKGNSPFADKFNRFGEPPANAMLCTALYNAWLDTRVLAAAYLLKKHNITKGERSAALRILSGELTDAAAGVRGASVSRSAQILTAYIRLDHRYRQDGNYAQWIESILDSWNRSNERMISGRIYSSFGADSIREMAREVFVLGSVAASANWRLPNTLVEFLLSREVSHQQRTNIVDGLRILNESQAEAAALATEFEIPAENLVYFSEYLNELSQLLSNQNSRLIAEAEIDFDQLAEYESHATNHAFQQLRSESPIALFQEISEAGPDQRIPEFTINIKDFDKASLAKDVDAQKAVNDKESISDIVERSVINRAFQRLLLALDQDEKRFNSTEAAIQHLAIELDRLIRQGASPIVFLADIGIRRKLEDRLWDENEEVIRDVTVTRRDGAARGYLFSFNSCDVFGLPLSGNLVPEAVVVTRDQLSQLRFLKFERDKYLEARFDDTGGAKGTLTLTFGLDMTLKHPRAVSVRVVKPDRS